MQKTLKKPELLAPAGNLEKLKFAIHYGADAVYIGGKQFGLRSNAGNFTFDEMREGVAFAEKYGSKVYVATNIIAHNENLDGAQEYYKNLYDAGIHAVIVADPALIQACREGAPDLEVHISTQASIANWKTAEFWKNEGIPRVVLAREVSVEEIREIKEKVDVEIEAFIHGAMCISYSGRCVLSNHMTARDANRGGCAQSCRWKYDLFENGVNDDTEVSDESDEMYTMSSQDLSMVEHLPDLIEAGVDSLKIEGRMKSIHYVATVVNVYRKIIDTYFEDPENYQLDQAWIDEIWKAAQRNLTTAFYYNEPTHKDQLYGKPERLPKYDFAGLVLEYDKETQMATIQQRNNFGVGDEVEFFGPNFFHFKQTITELYDEKGEPIDRAKHAMMITKVKVDQPVEYLNMMRKQK
ncbi:protease [Halolactibacillus alkaliphilus]|uniref:Protease n=1 Tax=Halolactibacillus alkaliphilus TaxID=442899 RepID=A0A511WZR2_9BACI|nr:U32 family peptidase [Halolactibacillus alkaliphilus]GEN56185.1 protease [Halolactibacillus alkaliphilus]GGN66689.1 protease [Halolactibacillus alkaliphilus]SFO68182.1 putative protease [Halolactibacillus alkaliphilus]